MTGPPNGSSYVQGTTVTFTGTASDTEQGNMSVPIDLLEVDTTGNAVGQPLQEMPARSGMAVIETPNYVVVIGTGTTA